MQAQKVLLAALMLACIPSLLGAKVTSGMMMNRRKNRRKKEKMRPKLELHLPCPPLSRERKRAGCYSVTKEIGFRATRLPAEPCVVALEIDGHFIRNFTVPGRRNSRKGNSWKLVIKVDNILVGLHDVAARLIHAGKIRSSDSLRFTVLQPWAEKNVKRECRVAGLCGSDIAADEDWSQSHMRIDNPRMQFFASVFSPEECSSIIAVAEDNGFKAATIGETNAGSGAENSAYRKASVSIVGENHANAWIFSRVRKLVLTTNAEKWRMRLGGGNDCRLHESFQIIKYNALNGSDFYDWHVDVGVNTYVALRKLSVTIQLTSPETHAGGGVLLRPGKDVVMAPRAIGSATIFPSYVLHRVLPMESGERISLVAWFSGCQSLG
eukprot:g1032.t1